MKIDSDNTLGLIILTIAVIIFVPHGFYLVIVGIVASILWLIWRDTREDEEDHSFAAPDQPEDKPSREIERYGWPRYRDSLRTDKD